MLPDFSERSLQGHLLKSQNLRSTNFGQTKTGLKLHSPIGLVLIALLLAAFFSFASVLAVTFVGYTLFPYSISPGKVLTTVIVLTLFFFFFRVALRENLASSYRQRGIAGDIKQV